MKAEIIAVGTELLLGQIVNSNAQYLSQQLAGLGIDVYFQTVVGDNRGRLIQALSLASGRADLVLCTGGLGPTEDDLTKEALAEFLQREIQMHEPSLDKIKQMFSSRGIEMVRNNERQAYTIEGAEPLANDNGLAIGTAISQEGKHYVLLPGPPREMKPMFEAQAKPWLRKIANEAVPLHSKMLKFAGIGESNLEYQLQDLIHGQTDPSIAPYAKEGEVTIRLSTKAMDSSEAERKLKNTAEQIRERLGKYLYAEEDVPIEDAVLQLMKRQSLTLSLAESCTGGLLGELLTSISGSSSVLKGGVICYSNELKHQLLRIPMDLMEGESAAGAVSEETAKLLAENMMHLAGTDIALSVTGVAGPVEVEGKPVGLVYIGLAQNGKQTVVVNAQFSGNRETVRLKAAKHALYMLWKQIRTA